MQTVQPATGITFAVDDVTPTTKVLTECKAHDAMRRLLGGDVESCSDYHGSVVSHLTYHPLLAAVYTAFNEHRPLVLTPDAVWLTIAQGVAHHMAIHGERLQSRFVSHRGKLELRCEGRGWVMKSPENPWAEAFEGWGSAIRDHVGPDVYPILACDFSTTGAVERAAGHVVMMDVFQRYFHYVLVAICGIPSVTLEGTPADWDRLLDKARRLRVFDMDWWLEKLLPVCEQFARAARGDVDVEHWRRICKVREEYGGDLINGWVAYLFPYVRAFYEGPCSRVNPVFEGGEGMNTFVAPSGLSRVPFTWRDAATGEERPMEAVAGLVGMTQDANTLALRPKVGWAVREVDKLDALLRRVSAEHVTRAGVNVGGPRPEKGGRARERESEFPPDLGRFYHHTNGADLFGDALRILPVGSVEPADWAGIHRGLRFATLRDGSFLVLSPEQGLEYPGRYDPMFRPVAYCRPDNVSKPGRNPVVALSFTELLQRVLDGGRGQDWLAEAGAKYGDANHYVRS